MPTTTATQSQSTAPLQIALPTALPFVLVPFGALHLIAGWNYYIENDLMLLSAILFMAGLLVVWAIQRGQAQRGPVLLMPVEIARLQRSIIPTSMGLVSVAWHGLVFIYLHFILGLSAEELRIMKSEAISGFVTLPMNAIALTGFTLLVLRRVGASNGRRRLSLDTILIYAILLAVVANGSRALMAQYVWIAVIILFCFRKIDFPKLAVLALTVLVALGAIKLLRYVLSDDRLALEYYQKIGAYDSTRPWQSLGNFLLIQLNDNP